VKRVNRMDMSKRYCSYEPPKQVVRNNKYLHPFLRASIQMKKLISTLVVGLFASAAFAQSPAPAQVPAPAAHPATHVAPSHKPAKKVAKKKQKKHVGKKKHVVKHVAAPAAKPAMH